MVKECSLFANEYTKDEVLLDDAYLYIKRVLPGNYLLQMELKNPGILFINIPGTEYWVSKDVKVIRTPRFIFKKLTPGDDPNTDELRCQILNYKVEDLTYDIHNDSLERIANSGYDIISNIAKDILNGLREANEELDHVEDDEEKEKQDMFFKNLLSKIPTIVSSIGYPITHKYDPFINLLRGDDSTEFSLHVLNTNLDKNYTYLKPYSYSIFGQPGISENDAVLSLSAHQVYSNDKRSIVGEFIYIKNNRKFIIKISTWQLEHDISKYISETRLSTVDNFPVNNTTVVSIYEVIDPINLLDPTDIYTRIPIIQTMCIHLENNVSRLTYFKDGCIKVIDKENLNNIVPNTEFSYNELLEMAKRAYTGRYDIESLFTETLPESLEKYLTL